MSQFMRSIKMPLYFASAGRPKMTGANIGKVILDYFTTPEDTINKFLSALDVVHKIWLSETHQLIIAKSEVFGFCEEDDAPDYYTLEWIPEIEGITATVVEKPPMMEPNKGGRKNPISNTKIETEQDPYRHTERFHAQVDVNINYLVNQYEENEMRRYLHETLKNLLTNTINEYRYRKLNV